MQVVYNLCPGQGLGYTASKNLAFGLGGYGIAIYNPSFPLCLNLMQELEYNILLTHESEYNILLENELEFYISLTHEVDKSCIN
jgi:hypothetical protein